VGTVISESSLNVVEIGAKIMRTEDLGNESLIITTLPQKLGGD
jgi:hypothetical protein